MERNPKAQYVFLYSIVQSCATEHEYYKAIIENLFKSDFTDKLDTLKNWGKDKLDTLRASIKGIKIADAGIEFDSKDRRLDQKIQFIFTGSIGLDTLVNKLNLSNLINALNTLSVEALSEGKADEFLDFIRNDPEENIELTTETKQYLLEKVGWLMPYYIELLWASLEDLCCDEEITKPTKAI